MTENADTPVTDVDAETVQAWMETRETVVVDVREASEYDFENIPGSVLLPLSFLDPDTFPPINDKKVVVVCAVGKRGEAARKTLANSGIDNIFNLVGGLHAWKQAGYETQGGKYEVADYDI